MSSVSTNHRTRIKRPRRDSSIGDLNTRIILHDRDIRTPLFEQTDFTEKFSKSVEVWANARTASGQTLFTDVNVDVALTHIIIIRFDSTVTSQTWIELDGKNIKIVNVEDLDERHEFLRLKCTLRGDKDLGSSQL